LRDYWVMANPQAAPERRPAGLADTDDAELVRRAQLGSAAAFEALVVRHGARLNRYLRVELRHESDAHDALQETLTAAWRGLPKLRRADRFWPWLVGIASHKAADIHRRRGRSVETQAEVTHEDDLLLETREALSALHARHREVLLLRYLLGLTEEEAAAALGVRVGTIKSRCSRARRALLEELR
jgi:RNA polymerase sigma factor (sigma-70 family)